jgi:hypothetical protein
MSPPAESTSAYAVIRALLAFADTGDCRGEKDRVEQILSGWCASGRPWELLAEEAEYHGVTPLLAPMITARFSPAPIATPNDARRIFVALARRHRRASAAREDCIDQLLTAFAAAKLPMLLLKGAALAHTLYPAPHLRATLDIDILIDPADERRVIDLVRDLGYSFARGQGSKFAGHFHHLPVATTIWSGFPIALDIHHDAMSPDQPNSLTLRTLTQPPQIVHRGARPSGIAFGHIDMLHHLTRHAFEPAHRIRLIHLYDLCRYRARFRDAIDWPALEQSHPHVMVVQQLVDSVFSRRDDAASHAQVVPAGIGTGMLPLSQIAAADIGLMAKMGKLFNPSAWWLHGYYGVPPERSLLVCRALRHPATVARWLGRRLVARAIAPAG